MRPILLSAVAVAIVALYAMPAAAQTTNQGETAEIMFEDQMMEGSTVTVDRVTLPEGGFVVLHDMSQSQSQDPNQQDPNQDQGMGQDIVGSSEYLAAGTHQNVRIQVDMQTGGTTTGSEMTLTAMLHMDTNNNQQFDYQGGQDGQTAGQEDTPYMQDGATVTDEARITMEGQTGDDNQTGDDGLGDGQDDGGLDDPGADDGFGDGEDDDPIDEEEDTPGFGVVALLAAVGAVAALRRR